MSDLDEAVEAFLDGADECLAEYDRGYADADATLRKLRTRIDRLREARE
ncbi:MAG: hypothetical protein ABEJ89_09990 [Haloarculaceae archaeon]